MTNRIKPQTHRLITPWRNMRRRDTLRRWPLGHAELAWNIFGKFSDSQPLRYVQTRVGNFHLMERPRLQADKSGGVRRLSCKETAKIATIVDQSIQFGISQLSPGKNGKRDGLLAESGKVDLGPIFTSRYFTIT